MNITAFYQHCRLCPRSCGVDRQAGSCGFCGETAELRIAFAGIHCGEEPPISGQGGSGTIFISGCNLGCVFCQNRQISQGAADGADSGTNGVLGRVVTSGEFAEICMKLQTRGAGNINIVTGSHAVPAIVQGINAARAAGLHIPVLWNSSAYESQAALDLLKDNVTMYLPDLKTLDSEIAENFFRAPDYPQVAAAAILKMMEMGSVIIRHLILPGCLDSTRSVLRWFAENAKGRALLSLMTQYTPMKGSGGKQTANGEKRGEVPARFLNKREYETVLGWLEEFGIEDGFCQELISSSRSRDSSDWLPDFNRGNPFSSELSAPVWHWRQISD
ncbi:radical SAM protein [Spirochaetia bacterium]|nr:radical SAM protein [Spirochaetia bacterium]